MKKNELLDNPLVDEGLKKVAKKGLNWYDWTTKMLWYISVAKWVFIGIAAGALMWGVYIGVSNMKDAVTGAVVGEVMEAASEKSAEMKATVKEKATGKSMEDLGAAFAKFAKKVEAKVDSAVDGALIESGYHPDAPAICARNPDGNKRECESFSDAELDGAGYLSISLWDTACPVTYAEAMRRLKTNGKITKNDDRELDPICINELDGRTNSKRDQMKADMIKEAGI